MCGLRQFASVSGHDQFTNTKFTTPIAKMLKYNCKFNRCVLFHLYKCPYGSLEKNCLDYQISTVEFSGFHSIPPNQHQGPRPGQQVELCTQRQTGSSSSSSSKSPPLFSPNEMGERRDVCLSVYLAGWADSGRRWWWWEVWWDLHICESLVPSSFLIPAPVHSFPDPYSPLWPTFVAVL